uniref:T9SS type A sorting domain-containing protein n=1 Tax=candidate division WOR-3 bacterium TaxID=2052148 RepID=A0A7C4TB30_UNCW3
MRKFAGRGDDMKWLLGIFEYRNLNKFLYLIEKRDEKIFRTNVRKLGIGDTIGIVGQRGFSGGIPLNILLLLGFVCLGRGQIDTVFFAKLRGIEVQEYNPGFEIDSITAYQSGEWVFLRAWCGPNFGDILGTKLKETSLQSAVPPVGYITGLLASGPDAEGYVYLTAVSDGGYSMDIIRTRLRGTGTKSFTAPNGYSITGFTTSGPDANGFVYLLIGSIGQIGIEEERKSSEKTIENLSFELKGPYPNPCGDHTRIFYSIARKGWVKLRIYDSTGRLVKTLINKNQDPGRYNLSWGGVDEEGRFVSSGIYFVKLDAGDFHATKKLLLLK